MQQTEQQAIKTFMHVISARCILEWRAFSINTQARVSQKNPKKTAHNTYSRILKDTKKVKEQSLNKSVILPKVKLRLKILDNI